MSDQSLKAKTARGLFWGGLSNGLQQVLALAFGIFLARKLTSADYGMVAMLLVYSLVASSIQESGFGTALAIRKKVSHRDFNAVFWFNCLSAAVLYVLLFAAAPLIAAYNHTPELTPVARVAFLSFVLSALGTAHFAWLFRSMMVRERTIAAFVGTVAAGTTGVVLVCCGFTYWALVAQDLCYKAVTTAFFWHYSRFRPTLRIDFGPIRSMFGFSSKLLVTSILNNLNNQCLQALLGHFYPRADVGYYSQAGKWNTMGYSLVGGMVGSIAQPVLAGVADERERQLRIFRKMLRFTAFVSCPALLGLALIAPEFVALALKSQWMGCVPYLQWLCLAGAFVPVAQLYSNLLISKERSAAYLAGIGSMLAVQVAAIYLLNPYGIQTLVYAVVALQISWLAVWHWLAARYTGLRAIHALCDVLPFFFVAAASMSVAWLAADATGGGMVQRLAVKVAVAACCYVGAMVLLRVAVFRECMTFFLSKWRGRHE